MEFVKMSEEITFIKEKLSVDFAEKFAKDEGRLKELIKGSFEAGFEIGFNVPRVI